MNAQPITHLMPDEELDVWADVYAQAKVADLISMPLSEFLQDPWNNLARAGQETAFECISNGHRPLLPQQVRASQSIHEQWSADEKADTGSKRNHLSLVSSR